MINTLIFNISSLFFVVCFLFYKYLQFLKFKHTTTVIEKYPNYLLFLEDTMTKSFDLVYADKIRPYSLEGMKLDDSMFNIALKNYVDLTYALMGSNMKKHFIEIYGDIETLTRLMTIFFTNKYENDKVREAVTEDLMSQDNIGE